MSTALLLSVLNPWGLSTGMWCACFIALRLALFVGIEGVVNVLCRFATKLPTRTGAKQPYQHPLGKLDAAYLSINAVIEFGFVNQLTWLLYNNPNIGLRLGCLGLSNTIVALWLLLVFDDMLYAPTHRLMHNPIVYKYVHKHHHRNTFPARGYIDAANEHPLEQIIALTLNWIAIHMVMYTSGLHAATVAAHLTFKAFGACLNHTGSDVRLKLMGIDYTVGAHEMHHRRPHTNFAQYVMFWDRLMGTYAPYATTDAKKEVSTS